MEDGWICHCQRQFHKGFSDSDAGDTERVVGFGSEVSGDTTEKEEAEEAVHSGDVVRIWVGFDDAIDGGRERDDERLTFDESFLGFGLRVHMYLKKNC